MFIQIHNQTITINDSKSNLSSDYLYFILSGFLGISWFSPWMLLIGIFPESSRLWNDPPKFLKPISTLRYALTFNWRCKWFLRDSSGFYVNSMTLPTILGFSFISRDSLGISRVVSDPLHAIRIVPICYRITIPATSWKHWRRFLDSFNREWCGSDDDGGRRSVRVKWEKKAILFFSPLAFCSKAFVEWNV